MPATARPEWAVTEDASLPVLLALCLRQLIGVRAPSELPHLRGVPSRYSDRTAEAQAALETQWTSYWDMTVEPRGHTSPVPLELVDGFDTLIALPKEGFDALREAIAPYDTTAVAMAQSMHAQYDRHAKGMGASSYRAYAGAVAEHERQVGRRAHPFELHVQVLPLNQRGLWWIGTLTVAVTDGLRQDVAAFDAAIHPIIADLA